MDTGISLTEDLDDLLKSQRSMKNKSVVFFVDHYFEKNGTLSDQLPINPQDLMIFVDTTNEPTTDGIDRQTERVVNQLEQTPLIQYPKSWYSLRQEYHHPNR